MNTAKVPGILGFESLCPECHRTQKVRSDGECFRWLPHDLVTPGFSWKASTVERCPRSDLLWEPMDMDEGWTKTPHRQGGGWVP